MHDPGVIDPFFAIWTILALPDPDGDPGIDDETLHELYDDLHRDLQRIRASESDIGFEAESDRVDYEEQLIALP